MDDGPGGTRDGIGRTDPAFLERLLHAGPYVIGTATGEGLFTSLRGPVYDLFKYKADEIVGTNFLDHVDLDSDPRQLESIGYALVHDGLRLPMQFKVRIADGTFRMVEVIADSALTDPMIQGLVVFIRPIDERLLLDRVLESMASGSALRETLSLAVGVLACDTLSSHGAIAYQPLERSFGALVATPEIGNPRPVGAPVEAPPGHLDPTDPDLPWNLARATGEEQLVRLADMAPDWAAEVAHLDVSTCWAVPVRASVTDAVEACIIIWRAPEFPPEPAHRVTVERLKGLLALAIDRDHQAGQLLFAARHDALTGLANREQFFERLTRELERARRDASPLAVLYLDLDGFKPVNDRHGHLAGDHVLVETARRIEAALRPDDLTARLGGDEFAVVCPRLAGVEEAHAIAARLVESIGRPISYGTTELHVGVSVGIARSVLGDHPEGLLDAADRALYLAKAEGKGRWVAAER